MKRPARKNQRPATRVPGFTAEASLFRAEGPYRSGTVSLLLGRLAVPQFTAMPPIVICGRLYCCDGNGNCFRKINLRGGGGAITVM
jgi:hypothetical protein